MSDDLQIDSQPPPEAGTNSVGPNPSPVDETPPQEAAPPLPLPSTENAEPDPLAAPAAEAKPQAEFNASPDAVPSLSSAIDEQPDTLDSEPVEPEKPKRSGGADADPLSQARQLLSEGFRDEALKLVIETLTDNPANPNGLYLYAQLTTDRENATQALKNALQLRPSFFEARLLLERLQGSEAAASAGVQSPGQAEVGQPTTTPAPPPPPPPGTGSPTEPILQQMLVQHQLLMQQQLVNQQQFTQQQLMNQQQFAQQQVMQRTVTAVVGPATNTTAFWIGAIAAFFGFFGIAHMINGRAGAGVVYLILGFVWDAIFATLAASIVGLCLAIPLHLVFVYLNAHGGASMAGGGQVNIRL